MLELRQLVSAKGSLPPFPSTSAFQIWCILQVKESAHLKNSPGPAYLLLELSQLLWLHFDGKLNILPLPRTSKSGNKFTCITLSSVMQEVFMQPQPLCNIYFISKRLIHTTKPLWTSFFPSADFFLSLCKEQLPKKTHTTLLSSEPK